MSSSGPRWTIAKSSSCKSSSVHVSVGAGHERLAVVLGVVLDAVAVVVIEQAVAVHDRAAIRDREARGAEARGDVEILAADAQAEVHAGVWHKR